MRIQEYAYIKLAAPTDEELLVIKMLQNDTAIKGRAKKKFNLGKLKDRASVITNWLFVARTELL